MTGQEAASQIKGNATAVPNVPGPKGQYPAKTPVAIAIDARFSHLLVFAGATFFLR
jgi:hypothetical protein